MEQIRNSRNPLNPLIFGNSDKSLSFGLPPHRQTSSAKDPVVEEFFDMELYLEEDTATHSDTSSEERSVAASFNTAPTSVGTAADDEDIVMLDPPLFSPVALTPEVVWPQVPNTGPPREVTISIDALTHTGPSPAPAKDQLDHCSRKTRTVKDTEKTSVVRSLGACTPCKMARVSCDQGALCERCSKPKWPVHLDQRMWCNRRELYELVGCETHRWCEAKDPDRQLADRLREATTGSQRIGGDPTLVQVISPRNPQNVLETQAFHSPSGDWRITIPPRTGSGQQTMIKPDQQLSDWVGPPMLRAGGRGGRFGDCIGRLLEALAGSAIWRSDPKSNLRGGAKKCLDDLVMMERMCEVWCCQKFFTTSLGYQPPFSDIQDYLYQHAGQVISERERDILREVAKLLNSPDAKEPAFRLKLDITIWAMLWQLCFIYQKSLRVGSQRLVSTNWRLVTEELYNKVVTIHSLHFRTRKILEQLSKPDPCIFRDDPELGKIFKDAWEARDSFYAGFRPDGNNDLLLKEIIIDNEKKKEKTTRKIACPR